MSDRPLLIVNPKAGSGRAGGTIEAMRQVVEGAMGTVDVSLTEHARHAVALAREAAMAGRGLVVAVGGDGSIHEVASGLLEARDAGHTGTRLGVIGQGTGGDFRKTLGIEHRLDHYVAALAGGATRRIDAGRFTYRAESGGEATAYFVNILSAGMGGLVDRYVHRTSKWLGGAAGYFVASARSLVEMRPVRLRATVAFEGRTEQHELFSRMIAVCNGRYFGSGMHVAPMAQPDDGVFEVVDLGGASRLKFALDSSAIYTGKHLDNPDVRHFRCERITLEPLGGERDEPVYLDVDGEALGRLPATIEVLRGALEVMVPPGRTTPH